MDVLIAGLGLIGGSLGKALTASGWHVAFHDPAVTLDQARAAGAAREQRAALQGGLIVLATPADTAVQLLGTLRGSAAVVTSVCSVMAPLRAAAGEVQLVAGHPFAGSERSGLEAAREDLFAGRPWFVEQDHPQVRAMVEAAGAEMVVIGAEEHDRLMALTSHLPQMMATALASLLEGVDPRYIGSGARSMLRLAGSSWEVWKPVLEMNRGPLEEAAAKLQGRLQELGGGDFERARHLYRALNPASGEPPER